METKTEAKNQEKSMKIETESMKRCEVVTVSGRVDSFTAPELEKLLLGLIKTGQKNIVVNLKDTKYMSSAGLKSLLSALMKVRRMKPRGDVVISEITPELKENFEIVGFNHLFKFFDRNERAIGSF